MNAFIKACIGLAVGLACSAAVAARPATASAAVQTIGLWPDGPPAGSGSAPSGDERIGRSGSGVGAVSNVSKPRIEIMRPAHPDGTAVLIVGGGGLFRIQIGHESQPTAQWLAALGVTPVILYYRLPADGWAPVAPYQDAQRAMRILRARGAALGIDPQHIGIIGFSSGGDIAGITATRFAHDFYTPTDATDKLSSRPDFAGLIYPVTSLQSPYDTTRTYRELAAQGDARTAYTVQLHVTPKTPPVFIAHAGDDPIVNVGSSLALFDALHRQHVPAELHVFEHGGHGWGLGQPGTRVGNWPGLFAGWIAGHGFLPPPGSVHAGSAPGPAPAKAASDDDDDN